jgi:PIN domain nuclease of toxin-antitoxin system
VIGRLSDTIWIERILRLLLDTHVLLWWLNGDETLSPAARAAIADGDAVVFVSAASALEITMKAAYGQLDAPDASRRLAIAMGAQGFRALEVNFGHALRAGGFPLVTHDVFDRLLAAQALTEKLTIVSDDTVFTDLGAPRLW